MNLQWGRLLVCLALCQLFLCLMYVGSEKFPREIHQILLFLLTKLSAKNDPSFAQIFQDILCSVCCDGWKARISPRILTFYTRHNPQACEQKHFLSVEQGSYHVNFLDGTFPFDFFWKRNRVMITLVIAPTCFWGIQKCAF